MSALTVVEHEFADLLERCKLPELTTKELLERFLAQSMAAEGMRKELTMLRAFEGEVRQAIADRDQVSAPQEKPATLVPVKLTVVRP